MLGLVGFQTAYVPGLFRREDLCQFQQAALELGRHLQTQVEGHNPRNVLSGARGTVRVPLAGQKMTPLSPTDIMS